MKAGLARQAITPPVGTRMLGFLRRDREGPSAAVHDELYVRALYVSHGNERALVASLDLVFLGREDADRMKTALGAALGLEPRQILLATTHTHGGPAVGTCLFEAYLPPQEAYLEQLDAVVVRAAERAKAEAVGVTVSAGLGRSAVPMSRRRPREDGSMAFAPNPDGVISDRLPVILFRDERGGRPVAALFSLACHPSTAGGFEFSADYPGVACAALDEHLGAPVSVFFQGAGGDAKVALSAREGKWVGNDWSIIDQAGRTLARETAEVIDSRLSPVEPALASAVVEVPLQLADPPPREELEQLAARLTPGASLWDQDLHALWAQRQLEQLDRGEPLPDAVPILVQGIQLGGGLRLVALEGEAVAELGLHVERCFDAGITVALGYANGQGLYLPVEHMLAEGGYEVDCAWEYGWPALLAEGAEAAVDRALPLLRRQGIR